MSARYEDVASEALRLEPRDRVRLARELAESLDEAEGSAEEIEALWLAEAKRRAEEIRNGAVETVDAQPALAEARRRLKE